MQREKLWSRFKGTGLRVPLLLEGTSGADQFLEALFGTREPGRAAPALFAAAVASPFEGWLIESHEALHALCEASPPNGLAIPDDVTEPAREPAARKPNSKQARRGT